MAQEILPHNPLEGPRPELNVTLSDGTEEQVSIIVIHKDRPEYLNLTLQSIAVCSFNSNYEIIVVDNGSGHDSQAFLEDLKTEGVKVVHCVAKDKEGRPNKYWAPAANLGVQAADKNSKYYIFLHHDVVILNSAWIDMLANVSEAQNAGMVGVELQSYYLQNQKVDFIQEWCLLMTKECYRDVGPFPETLPQIGTTFVTTMAAQQKGWKPQVLRNGIAHHYRVFALDINDFEQLTEKAMTEIPKLMRGIHSEAV